MKRSLFFLRSRTTRFTAPFLLAVSLLGAALAQYNLDKGTDFYLYGTQSEAERSGQDDLTLYRAAYSYNRPLQDVPYDPERQWGIFWGLEYEYNNLDLGSEGLYSSYDLHLLRFPLQVLYQPGGSEGKWLFGSLIKPGVATDFEGISADDLTIAVLLTASYRFNSSFELGVGAYYSTVFGSPTLLPGVGFRWKICDDWRLAVFPPVGTLQWDVAESWQLEAYVRPSGGYWQIDDAAEDEVENLGLSSWRSGLRLEYELENESKFFVGAGVSFGNSVEFTDSDDDELFERDYNSSAFAEIGYHWAF